MSNKTNFREVVETILKRYSNTSLVSRWEEAASISPDVEPLAFWTHCTDEFANIVWLTRHAVLDITLFFEDNTSTFNLLRYNAVTGFEIREGSKAAKSFGLKVNGEYAIHVQASSERGGLFWVAATHEGKTELRAFIDKFAKMLLEG